MCESLQLARLHRLNYRCIVRTGHAYGLYIIITWFTVTYCCRGMGAVRVEFRGVTPDFSGLPSPYVPGRGGATQKKRVSTHSFDQLTSHIMAAYIARFTGTGVAVGPDVSRAALRLHPVGTPAESAPGVSWALEERRWPPPIAAAWSLGALPRPGCAHTEADPVHRAVGQMCTVLGRGYGFTPSVHRLNPLHG